MSDIKEAEAVLAGLLAENQPDILKELGSYLEAVVVAAETAPVQPETIQEYVAIEQQLHQQFSALFEQAKAKAPQPAAFQELAQTVDAFLSLSAS